MLWSGSSLWFLAVGIILLGAAAVFFLARRPAEAAFARQTGSQETGQAPLILAALGVLFLAMLLIPNFAGGDSGPRVVTPQQSQAPSEPISEVSGAQEPPAEDVLPPAQELPAQQPPAQDPPVQEEPALEPPVQEEVLPPPDETVFDEGELYVVQDGDNLWDIAQTFGITVDAIIGANEMDSPEELQLGQELVIPAAEDDAVLSGAVE